MNKKILLILVLLLIILFLIVFGMKNKNLKIENNMDIDNTSNIRVDKPEDVNNKAARYLSDEEKARYGIETKEEVPVGFITAGDDSLGSLPKIYLPKEYVLEQSSVIDTDNDGLFDKEEKKYGTDSNLADTDGDGYTDADEIKNGYNPLGK